MGGLVFLPHGLLEAAHVPRDLFSDQSLSDARPGERPSAGCSYGTLTSPLLLCFLPSSQGILRNGLEEVKQFFALNGSCRLPLSPSLLVKGIVPRVSDQWVWGSWSGEDSVEVRSLHTHLLRKMRKKGMFGVLPQPWRTGTFPQQLWGNRVEC